MKTSGGSHSEAEAWLSEHWPYCSDHTQSFTDFLDHYKPN
jgi:hypothetical protein